MASLSAGEPDWSSPVSATTTRPVLFDVYRDDKLLTSALLSCRPPGKRNQSAPAYIDGAVEILLHPASHSYRVAPIDLFGQTGVPSVKAQVEVNDLPAPPPPIRLRPGSPSPTGLP